MDAKMKEARGRVMQQQDAMKTKAVRELREYLKTRSKLDKDVLWAFFDGDPRAIEWLIASVGTKKGTPNDNQFNKWKPKAPKPNESVKAPKMVMLSEGCDL